MSYDGMDDIPWQGNSRRPQGGGQPARRGKPDLGKYVEVKDRLTAFYAKFPEGRLESNIVPAFSRIDRIDIEIVPAKGDKPEKRIPHAVGIVTVEARAYRTPDDPHPATGLSSMLIPGQTPYTNGSELENAETSAWGRAFAALDLLNSGGIASRDEVVKNQKHDDVDEEIAAAEAFAAAQTAAAPPAVASVAPPVASPATEDPGAVSVAPEPAGGQENAPESVPAPEESGITMTKFLDEIKVNRIFTGTVDSSGKTLFPETPKTAQLTDQQRADLLDALLEDARLNQQDAKEKAEEARERGAR